MKKTFFFFLWMSLCSVSFAQDSSDRDTGIRVEADPRIEKILQRKKDLFQLDSTNIGYRIQIFASTDRKEAMLELENFQLKYPEVSIYMKYDSPNFKLRVGDFSGKVEAQYWFARLQEEFPNLFLVPDKVNPMRFPE